MDILPLAVGEVTSEDMANTESGIEIDWTKGKGLEETPSPSTATATVKQTTATKALSSFVSTSTENIARPIATGATASTIVPAIATTAKATRAEAKPEEITEEYAQYDDDYNYGWKEESNEDVLGGEKGKEKVLYEDKCIYSSTLLLWDEDFDFNAITTEDIRDKITRALDDE